MATSQTLRPKFFEGQYLGAEDLTAAVDYTRIQESRHLLGAHTWGIAIGLHLKEVPQPGGALQVFLQPGYAWDGFGRPLVVLSPFAVPAELFKSLVYNAAGDEPGGRLVAVWLRYRESSTRQPSPGFETCNNPDQNSRVQETFSLEIGDRLPSEQHDNINVAGSSVPASQAFQALDATDPLIPDESIPHQAFPAPGSNAKWLIPLGYVRWKPNPIAGQPGSFQPTTVADRAASAAIRVNIGAIAAAVQAADGVLRLKNRTTAPSGVLSNDLVWAEGNVRVEGDVRLFGGTLSLLNAQGNDNGVPLTVQRAGDSPPAGRQMRLEIGAAQAGQNSLQIGPTIAGTYTPKMAVLDNGRVGIGTVAPGEKLEINDGNLLLKASGNDPGDLIFQDSTGAEKGRVWTKPAAGAGLNLSSGGTTPHIAIDANGLVGIGTTAPDRAVTVQGGAGTYLNVKGNGGAQEVLIGADGSGGIISAMTNHDLQLRAGSNVTRMTVKSDGKVAVGLNSPVCRLHVQDSIDGDAVNVSAHVAVIDNASGGDSADVLALRIARSQATNGNNYITFFAGSNPSGRIEGDGAGGVSYVTTGADFAECLPKLADEPLEAGDVVGVVGGMVTRRTQDAHHVSVITARAAVLGNAPLKHQASAFGRVAMIGQVAVKVRGSVRAGDLIVPSGMDDGTAVAVAPDEAAARGICLVVGTAWESSSDDGVKPVNTAVGLTGSLLRMQHAEIQSLRKRLKAIEDQ